MEGVRAHAWWAAKVWFPAVEGCRFTHAWKSVLCIPRDQMPTIGFNPRTRVAFAFGDSGEGVATSNRSGCALADLLSGADSGLTRPPMADHTPKHWEPERSRDAGVAFVRRSRFEGAAEVERTCRDPERTGPPQRLFDD